MPFSALHKDLEERKAQGLLRARRSLSTPQGAHIKVDGRPFLSFCSNDYLGLANHPALIKGLQQGAQEYGAGAGASHLVSGNFAVHEQFEQAFAGFVGKPAALAFSNGYMANLGIVQSLVDRGDFIFADKLNHASLNDAMQLSHAAVKRYRHNNMHQLESLLQHALSGRKLIITDAVFSMDGDLAPVHDLLALADKYDAWLLLDDAHGFGVLGDQGRGILSHCKVDSPRILYMATLGKAAGVAGAVVAAEQVVIDTLLNFSRSYIYTTASPPALSSALLGSLSLIREAAEGRSNLFELIEYFKSAVKGLPWQLMKSNTPIQPLLVGSNEAAMKLSDALRDHGIWVPAIRPPTVPEGSARLRITFSAAHQRTDVDRLLVALHALAH